MLKKLLKYEYKATGRTLLPLYGGILIFSIITKIFSMINEFFQSDSTGSFWQNMQGLSSFAYGIIIFSTFIITFFIALQRFYTNLLGDEGYLMFTLPVKTWMHIVSKLVTAVTWIVSSVIVFISSLIILLANDDFFSTLSNFWDFFIEVFSIIPGTNPGIAFAEITLMALAVAVEFLLTFYFAITIGRQLFKKKLLGIFVSYIGLNFAKQTISSIVLTIFMLSNVSFDLANTGFSTMLHILFLYLFVFSVLISTVCFFITNSILKKKLNLE